VRGQRLLLVLVLGLATIAAACSPAAGIPAMTPLPSSCPSTGPSTVRVHKSTVDLIQACDYRFDPATVVLHKGSVTNLTIRNTGSVLHNFTIDGTSISVDVAPGHTSRLLAVGQKLAPGSYTFSCKYYAGRGMTGVLVVNAASSS